MCLLVLTETCGDLGLVVGCIMGPEIVHADVRPFVKKVQYISEDNKW
jgi:hypothetical protein